MGVTDGELSYKPLYKQGDGINFTVKDDTVKYSQTGISVNTDNNTIVIDETN